MEKIYAVKDGKDRTQVTLSFDPWESYYVVFDRGEQIDTGLARSDDIEVPKLQIDLAGKWDFIPVGRMLDYKWQSRVTDSRIELAVMDVLIDRGHSSRIPASEDGFWKQVKLKDSYSELKGCGRYLSCWDGWWITYADAKPHWGTFGGKEIRFRKVVSIDGAVEKAWLGITAEKSYELFINGKLIGTDDDYKTAETYDIASYLKEGENLFEVVVKDAGALLLQGQIVSENGKDIKIVSDRTWQVCSEGGIWSEAFEYVNPPLGPWGNIELEKEPLSLPVNVWYRQELPAGAIGIAAPVIKGDYQIFVNGQIVKFKRKQRQIIFKRLLNGRKNILLVKVNARDLSDGIIEPVEVLCKPTEVELGLWADLGLNWYSGRCLYSKEFVITDEHLAADTKLVLELGEVKYFVEVWVNDKLVGYKIWPPYQMEIQDYLKTGRNTITLVVSNLIANEMKWNIFDESLTNPRARWGHDFGILRKPGILSSGILGPVKITPFKMRNIETAMYKK